ncbi:MAG: hypothetical protein ABMA25_00315 [Ilumatobacteraceae bacterium]
MLSLTLFTFHPRRPSSPLGSNMPDSAFSWKVQWLSSRVCRLRFTDVWSQPPSREAK